jgi:hypothetical protein
MKKILWLCFLLAALRWNAALCLDVCIPLLERQLNSITGVANLTIDPRAGAATLEWKPNVSFNYAPINIATRAAGIRVSDARIRVRGTISHDNANVYISSLGDNTRFNLLGPINPIPGHYIVQSNIASHPLPLKMRDELLLAEAKNQMVTVEGPLFEPLRYVLAIVVEQVQYPEEQEKPRPGHHPLHRY